jgi:hypothetical protein
MEATLIGAGLSRRVDKAIGTRERAGRWCAHHLFAFDLVGAAQSTPLPALRAFVDPRPGLTNTKRKI